jgi:broad specificity phosphatase PhoE
LHEIGKKQALAVGNRLSKARIDAVYSSHLLRALHTAEAIASHHNLEVGVFEDLELAELVAIEARNKYHKEFARHL